MSRQPRIVIPELSHHLTARGNNSQDIFGDDHDRRFYLALLAECCEKHGLSIEAYCLMINHIHLVGVPSHNDSVALSIGHAHQQYARYFNERYDRTGHLWGERVFSSPMDVLYRSYAIRYVECNPTRARLVSEAWEYPWSSAAAHCGRSAPHPVLGDLSEWRGAVETGFWLELLRGGGCPVQAARLRRRTRAGKPLGSATFISEIEEQIGRYLVPRAVAVTGDSHG